MAAQALGPGTTIVRRRAFFGLLDAGGWAWATLKAAFWFVAIIMLMALPPGPRPLRHRPADDRARRPAPDVQQEPQRHAGQPLPARRTRRCPARPRSGRSCPGSRTRRSSGSRRRARTRRSWRPASRRSSSAARTGRRPRTASSPPSSGRTATSTAGRRVPPCPRRAPAPPPSSSRDRPTSSAALDAGGAPTDTVFVGTPDAATGKITAWSRVRPTSSSPRRAPMPPPSSPATGSSSSAGATRAAPSTSVWKAPLKRDDRQAQGVARPPARCPPRGRAPRPCSRARTSSSTAARMPPGRRPRSCAARSAPSRATDPGMVTGWSTPTAEAAAADEPPAGPRRARWASSRTAILYYVGGEGGAGELYWTIPDADGNLGRLEDARPERAAGRPPAGRRRPDRLRVARVPRRGDGGRGRDAGRRAGEPRAAAAVLPAGPLLHRGAGARHRRRGGPAALLPGRRGRRDRQLRAPAPHRVRLQPQGADEGALRADPRTGGAARRSRPTRRARDAAALASCDRPPRGRGQPSRQLAARRRAGRRAPLATRRPARRRRQRVRPGRPRPARAARAGPRGRPAAQATMPPATLWTSLQPLRSSHAVTAADRLPLLQITWSGRSRGSSSKRRRNDEVG